MKLFGDTGSHQHAGNKKSFFSSHEKEAVTPAHAEEQASVKAEQVPVAAMSEMPAAEEKERCSVNKLFDAPIWRKLRIPLIVLCALVLLALVAVLVYSIWEKPPEIAAERPNEQSVPAAIVSVPTKPDDAVQVKETETEPDDAETELETEETAVSTVIQRKEDCYTFVILVYDQLQANTDAILVGRMDAANGTLDLVNIPRDTLVNVSWGVKKINTVLASERNDINRFMEQLGNLIGFTVDCYAVADIRVVEKLVDCIGGVYYNVPRDMDYDDPTQNLSIHIAKGYQLLDGENAVKVMRFRMGNNNTGYVNGDLGRIATQQDFLKTMAAQFLSLGNIPNIDRAIEIVQTYVKTNMTANNIAFFLREFLLMDKENIRFHTLPGTGAYIRGGAYLEVNLDEWVAMLNESLNPFNQEITADHLNILQRSGSDGAVSTTGETIPITSFYDFSQYTG